MSGPPPHLPHPSPFSSNPLWLVVVPRACGGAWLAHLHTHIYVVSLFRDTELSPPSNGGPPSSGGGLGPVLDLPSTLVNDKIKRG